MFKKHTFTCPDVIYLRNRQKQINRVNLGAMIVFYGGLWAYGYALQRREANAPHDTETPTS